MAKDYDYPKGLVQRALREGESAASTLRAFRAAGGRIRTQTWQRMYAQAQLEGLMTSREFGAQQNRVPTSEFIQKSTSRRAEGLMQRAVVFLRNADGLVISKDISIRTDRLRSRQDVVDKALAIMQGALTDPETSERYAVSAILGGAYTGTFDLEPEE